MITLAPLLTAACQTLVLYLFLVGGLRFLGRRQLGQMTVVDLMVVIILGSAVETAMVGGNTSVPVGLVSALTLLLANRALTVLFARSHRLRHLVLGVPVLLVRDGHIIEEHLRRAGLTHEDVQQAVRERGEADLSDVRYAVLEVDGTINVVSRETAAAATSGPPPQRSGTTHHE